MTTIQIRNSVGWPVDVLVGLLKVGQPVLRVDGEELMPNGRFQVAVVTLDSVEAAQEFYATMQAALHEINRSTQ